ncbi:hypothetical protein CAY60_002160 [Shouchella clausii]|uniref:Uncharacterized protein n=1 Tax=Shouchella rhizosphaerae TaxID=866786 RepID=A0ABZ2D1D4_9BACI|nr:MULTISPECIES: hypothetical protein [Shouchella]ALA53877.1 hypothetical protein DB29_03049 [Shouchella clausii]MDO7266209.1 hypothetical protein [Shouchella clausii]MDO7285661.1 hypothetical protein [Shouchella clausii]MDO7286876.1 hypothetical protein [Shouchella clausii]MDO7305445.1 hypothetical protein [Shouchella clausii]
MTTKRWILAAVCYLILVVGGYGLLTGTNPFESTDVHESEHHE